MVGAASGNDTVQQEEPHGEKDLQHCGVDEGIEEAITADAVPDQRKEAVSGAATAEDQQKERTPIVWVGRSTESPAATPSRAAELPATVNDKTAERPVLRLKPNAGFLLNLVADAERGNKRKCAEEATQVSLNVLGQVVAAGVRPHLARGGPDASNAAVRRVVLSVAQQQKLAACSALLREVAAFFGFALHVAPDVGDENQEEGEDGEETTASGGDGSGTGGLAKGDTAADRERLGFQTLQPLRIRLNVASQREKAKPENAGPADEDDADMAPRPPKPRAPGINMAASRLAGAALGAIGVANPLANPDKAHALARPSQSQAPQKLAAKGEGRTALFGHDGEDEAMSEVDLKELEDLDEGDVEVNGRGAGVDSAGQSADDDQHPTSKEEQLLPGKGQRRGGLRMDAHDLNEPEEDLEGYVDGQATAGNRQRKSPAPGSHVDSMPRKRSQSGTPASRAGAADASRQRKQAGGVQPAVDVARLLSRASAAASGAQQRRDTSEGLSAEAAAGSSADDVDDPEMLAGARGGSTQNGAATLQSGKRSAQGVLASAARQRKRAREEDEVSNGIEQKPRDQEGGQKSERSKELQKDRVNVKSGERAGRGLFGAAMAGLNGR
ncbi:g4644 [Coccomyxa elongata]